MVINILVFFIFILFEVLIFLMPWGVIFLNLYIVFLLLLFRPSSMIHPSSMVFAYYFLWVILPSTLDFIYQIFNISYILPWGRLWDWSDINYYVLLQIQINITTLILVFYFTIGKNRPKIFNINKQYIFNFSKKIPNLFFMHVLSISISIFYIIQTGGFDVWINNYALAFLKNREGFGYLNILVTTIGYVTIFLSGIKNYGRNGNLFGIIYVIPTILILGFIGGFKSRIFILILIFFFPYLSELRVKLPRLLKYSILFFGVLYISTQVRSSGFYSGIPRYTEMMMSYFNAYPLHNIIVERENPSFMMTFHHFIIKPGQYLGLFNDNAEYDISVMLTKELFPDMWAMFSATQQWPIETDMYYNFFGVIGQIFPMIIYACIISKIYKLGMNQGNIYFIIIYALEFIRIISTLRGTLIPWSLLILIVQYLFIFFAINIICHRAHKSVRKPH